MSAVQSEVSHANSLVITPVPQAPAQAKPPSVSNDQNVASVSWADQATGLVEAVPRLMFNSRKLSVRVRGQASTSSVKGVPRQLTCFATRLHLDVTEQELAEFLQGQDILDVKYRKVVAKDGHVFRTSAFRVSCNSRYESLFYDEATWPEGVELRDWVFYSNNGR